MNFASGLITSIAGTGEQGYTGDGGLAVAAQLSEPFMCALDAQGSLYIAEATNHCIRRVDTRTGVITTVAGTGELGYSGDGGPATQATFNQPYAFEIDTNGDLYIVDRLNAVIRKVEAATGLISTVVGTGEPGTSPDHGLATQSALNEPNDCFLDNQGGLLIADIQDQRVRRFDLRSGLLTTFAGNGEKARIGDGLLAIEASILGARAVCMDRLGNTYICEREGNGLRKVDVHGIMSTFAGTGERGYSGDGGPALSASWGAPKALRCDAQNNIVVVDTENHAIRRIDGTTGLVTTLAGGQHGSDGDGGPAIEAGLDRPHGCAIDAQGNLFIADSNNHRVRVVGA